MAEYDTLEEQAECGELSWICCLSQEQLNTITTSGLSSGQWRTIRRKACGCALKSQPMPDRPSPPVGGDCAARMTSLLCGPTGSTILSGLNTILGVVEGSQGVDPTQVTTLKLLKTFIVSASAKCASGGLTQSDVDLLCQSAPSITTLLKAMTVTGIGPLGPGLIGRGLSYGLTNMITSWLGECCRAAGQPTPTNTDTPTGRQPNTNVPDQIDPGEDRQPIEPQSGTPTGTGDPKASSPDDIDEVAPPPGDIPIDDVPDPGDATDPLGSSPVDPNDVFGPGDGSDIPDDGSDTGGGDGDVIDDVIGALPDAGDTWGGFGYGDEDDGGGYGGDEDNSGFGGNENAW